MKCLYVFVRELNHYFLPTMYVCVCEDKKKKAVYFLIKQQKLSVRKIQETRKI